jgi:WD repeat-containing protein 22
VGKDKPKVMQAEHLSNIFSLAFDCTKTKVLSAGNDDQVILHDLERLGIRKINHR